jgi:hypothetical protein
MTSSKYSNAKNVVLAAAIVTGMTGIALAQENSMSRFSGGSSAYPNEPTSNAPADLAWRQRHPNGHTQLELQRLTSRSTSFQPAPVLSGAVAAPAWRVSHPEGTTERQLQAMSSEAPAWGLGRSGAVALASDNQTDFAQSPNKETFAARLARFFHPQAPERASTAEDDRR